MKYVLLIVFMLMFQNMFSQAEQVEIITHKVELGETMLMISKKYLVNPTEIYKINKTAINGITPGMVLAIPQPIKSQKIITARAETKVKIAKIEQLEPTESLDNQSIFSENVLDEDTSDIKRKTTYKINTNLEKKHIEHEVKSGETFVSLSKKYEIPIDVIKEDNKEILKKGIKEGQILQILVIPKLDSSDEQTEIDTIITKDKISTILQKDKLITHKVVYKETLYSISRKYNIPVKDIQKQNESVLINGLKQGQELTISVDNISISAKNNASNETNKINTSKEAELITHKVVYGETLYSISRKYNIPVKDIQKQNESVLVNGLKQGQELTISVDNTSISAKNNALNETNKTNTSEEAELIIHKVVYGETLYSISRKYNIAVEDIQKINESVLVNGLKEGQELLIKTKK